jgi:uncharacterized membrane-anchored protein YhcB (DUF1043 family)
MSNKKEFIEKRDRREAFAKEREKLEFRLQQFRRNIKHGFSDANFATMAYDYNKLSKHLSLEELTVLGNLWSASYTRVPPVEIIDEQINKILENNF